MGRISRIGTISVCALALVAGIWSIAAAQSTDESKENSDLKAQVASLEKRLAKLEKQVQEMNRLRVMPIVPSRPPTSLLPIVPPQMPNSLIPRTVPQGQIPPGWVEHEINGMKFYLVPIEGQQIKPK